MLASFLEARIGLNLGREIRRVLASPRSIIYGKTARSRVDDGLCRPDVGKRVGVGDDNGTLPRKDLAKCRAYEGAGVRDENALTRKDVVHGRTLLRRAKLADDHTDEATTAVTRTVTGMTRLVGACPVD